jgi:hypothetical protein
MTKEDEEFGSGELDCLLAFLLSCLPARLPACQPICLHACLLVACLGCAHACSPVCLPCVALPYLLYLALLRFALLNSLLPFACVALRSFNHFALLCSVLLFLS